MKMNVASLLLVVVAFFILNGHMIISNVNGKTIRRCPEDFDERHPINKEEEMKIHELMIKRAEIDPVIKQLMSQSNGNSGDALVSGGSASDTGQIVTIPVIFHIVQRSSNDQVVPLTAIQANIDAMNDGYSGTVSPGGFADSKIRFALQAVHTVINKSWFNYCGSKSYEMAMKKGTSISPEKNLNVYVCNPRGLLGYAYFPQDFSEDNVIHGVVMNFRSFPAVDGYKPIAAYNEGDTLTHEVGHYLGLYHTFQGGCYNKDLISDTPAEKSPAFGKACKLARPRNTCPSPGNDPVTNFMDYTDDVCLNNFTPLQAARMRTMLFQYRPTIAQNNALQCVSGGKVGNVGSWKMCTSQCFTTKTPNNTAAPSGGWCYTSSANDKWGDCCCLTNSCEPGSNIYAPSS